jgi:hypothetical protein
VAIRESGAAIRRAFRVYVRAFVGGKLRPKMVHTPKEVRDVDTHTIVDVTSFAIEHDIRFREESTRRCGLQSWATLPEQLYTL